MSFNAGKGKLICIVGMNLYEAVDKKRATHKEVRNFLVTEIGQIKYPNKIFMIYDFCTSCYLFILCWIRR